MLFIILALIVVAAIILLSYRPGTGGTRGRRPHPGRRMQLAPPGP